MIEFDKVLFKLKEIKEAVEGVGNALNLSVLEKNLKELKAKQEEENFWQDLKNSQNVGKEISRLENKIDVYNGLKKRLDDVEMLTEMCVEEGETSEIAAIEKELESLEKAAEEALIATLLKGKYDSLNAILTLHSGAGGTESCDWVSMLFRMYSRYIEKSGWNLKVLDSLDGDEAGIKSITFIAEGDNAYGYLKAEMGVHRLVRISPFDSNKRRHTSFASLEVMPEIEDEGEVKINTEELKIDTYRAGGAGGQHVNKTESAIRITHLPTGIIVQCQNERSQIQNRETAMKMLRSKLIEKRERERLEHEANLKGNLKKIEWGSQIRSYVFCPYTLVKDHRTSHEIPDVHKVMDGEIEDFIREYLKKI
jgi:peptide chain release factor 2